MKPWIEKNDTLIHENLPYHRVFKFDYLLPNGSEIKDHLRVYHPDWINMIVVKDKQVAFIRQYRPGITDFTYELPGGICKWFEKFRAIDILDTVTNELREELGLILSTPPIHVMSAAVNPSTHNNQCHTYLVANPDRSIGGNSPELTEDLEIRWIPFEYLIEFMQESVVASLSLAPLWKLMYNLGDYRGAFRF